MQLESPAHPGVTVADAQRIRQFILVEGLANLIILTVILLVGSAIEIRALLVITAANAAMLVATYLLRRSAYAEPVIYVNLAVIALLIALGGPLSGRVDGSAWVLFQIPPLVATLVLNKPRSTLIVCLVTGTMMSIVIGLELSGVIAVDLVVPMSALLVNFGMQLLTLAIIAVTVWVVVGRAQRALGEARTATQRLEQQLSGERELAAERERINRELAASLSALGERDAQLRSEQAQQDALRSVLRERSTPVIPILDGVVVMPLTGVLDERQIDDMTTTLLTNISALKARMAIIDVTGLTTIDPRLGAALLETATACRMLGATPILAGIRPDAAQTLVSLGLDLAGITTVTNLQSGVEYALNARRSSPGTLPGELLRPRNQRPT
jgi:anti-anti-sigma regulatory factor